MIGEISDKTPLSSYSPSQEVSALTKMVKDDYAEGSRILNQSWVELNDRSVVDDENRGKLMFNAFVDESVEDPYEAWKWRGTRSMARNKGIAMHAQLTANILLPLFIAQNDDDEVDKDASEIMRDIIEWLIEPTNSNYQSQFLQIVFSMETNPVTFLSPEYIEVFQEIKEKSVTGEYTTKEVLDEVLSGFNVSIYSSTEVLITNAYERNMQRQKSAIKVKYVDMSEAEALFGEHENFGHIQAGVKSIYNAEQGLFYDVFDDDHPNLVAVETYMSRRKDLEVTFVNGVYVGDDNVDHNPIKHRDNQNAPKYNLVPFGFSRIGEHFFYYKSMMNAMGWDNMLYDSMSEVIMNRAFLETEMPIAISGTDQVDSSVIFPGSVASFEDKDTRVNSLLPPSNSSLGIASLEMTKDSMANASVNDTVGGDLPQASQKAFNVAQAQQNSEKIITGVAKPLVESVALLGDLMKDIAINHITVAEVQELIGGGQKMKYPSFLLQNKSSGGKVLDRMIKFDSSLIGAEFTEKEKKERKLQLLQDSGYPNKKHSLRNVNPEMFAKFKYLTKVDVTEMFKKNKDYWQPVLMNLKAQLVNDPYTNQEGLTRKLMYSFFDSEGDELVVDQPSQLPGEQLEQEDLPRGQFAAQAQNQATTNAVKQMQ